MVFPERHECYSDNLLLFPSTCNTQNHANTIEYLIDFM